MNENKQGVIRVVNFGDFIWNIHNPGNGRGAY